MKYSHLSLSNYCLEAYQRADLIVNNYQCIIPAADLIVFRGTDELRDWLSNARMILFNGRKFNAELEPLIGQLLTRDPALTFPITLAGHSLGGEIAKRIGERLVSMGLQVQQIVTFAPPRTGKSKILKDTLYVAHRNGNDIVTYVPGFRHQTKPIQLAHHYSPRVLSRHKMSEYNALMRLRYGL